MRLAHSIRAMLATLALAAPHVAAAQAPAQGAQAPFQIDPGEATFTIFVRSIPIGTETVTVARSADGWTITSSGRLGPPVDIVARRLQVRYNAEWHPFEFTYDGTARGQAQSIHTLIEGTKATSDIVANNQTSQKIDAIDPNALVVMASNFFGPYEAVAARLKTAAVGAEIPIFGPAQLSFTIRVGETSAAPIQTTARLINARRTHISLILPGAPLDGELWTDESGRMVRFSMIAQGLDVVRKDVAAVSSRSVTISRPNDEPAKIPANGFILAGTLSRPIQTSTTPKILPAVVLVGGSGAIDRDGLAFGIPVLGQLADAIADAGFIVVRYDKRGIGQSGGRAESAGLAEYAEDARAAVQWLSKRKDVDRKKIVVIGHSEGGAVALIAASKDKSIAAVGLLSANGVTGAQLILAQQAHALDRLKLSVADRQAKVDLQKKIHEAVLTGKGWETMPAEVNRRQVDNPEFQSLLANDPAKVIPEVRQPILIVQGELDTQVEPSNADRLEAMAKKRKNAPPVNMVEMVKLPGINHLLVPATTGEVEEYGALKDKTVSPAVTQAIVTWLTKTLSAAR
ncbi:MAG: alpha/beta fold hydrolase [Acidobacteria bacterium]|nr:alpha/beta fold hydrolase [Acidobacteriota bacterium]